jgi:ribose transport system permease protein
MAVGETFVILSGGIDLSVGSTVGLSGVFAALAMRSMTQSGQGENFTILVGTLIAMAVGLVIGLINAFLITKARMVPFVATLATLGAARGLCIVTTGGGPVGEGPEKAITYSVPWFGPFNTPTLIIVVIVAVCGLFMHKAKFGRYTYAIGSNSFAARSAGINVKFHLAKVYVLSGVLSGLAGMYLYIRLGSGSPSSGASGELMAIAAVVIGGASLSGGVGRMSGTVLGSLILTTVTSGLIIIGVAPNWNQVVVAILIAGAVFIQGFRTWTKD